MQALEYVVATLATIRHELLLFAGFWFILGALDDFGIDVCWLWLKLTGRAREGAITAQAAAAPLSGRAAVFIAAWQEAGVIGATITHALSAWKQREVTLYLGCYCNDPDTIAAAMKAAGDDPRVRLVITDRPGPTTKADCLNRVYAALCADERRYGWQYRSIILHDAEDMVHSAELAAIDAGLADADFVQLPVLPETQPSSPWVAGHYSDEFAEAHAKVMVVRDALGASIPAAGVGCGFSRAMIARIARRRGRADGSRGQASPFAAECLTEDYELGLLVRREGGRSRFLRIRDAEGALVATRAYFPDTLEASVRQKSRWIHGIAFQGWDRLGWTDGGWSASRMAELWMALRDRRGPLTAIVLACAYLLVVIEGVLALAGFAGIRAAQPMSSLMEWIAWLCLMGLLWRSAFRVFFTTREYDLIEGLNAIARIPVANFIAIFAGRRALAGYVQCLRGVAVRWEKTRHEGHPALAASPVGVLVR